MHAEVDRMREGGDHAVHECAECHEDGAMIGCLMQECRRAYHYGCAKRAANCYRIKFDNPAAQWLPKHCWCRS